MGESMAGVRLRSPVQEQMGLESVPYFPLKLVQEREAWLLVNPLTGVSSEINGPAYSLLRLCDGYRTLAEVIEELQRSYQSERSDILAVAEPLLRMLSDQGVLWQLRRRMNWWRLPPPVAVLWDLTGRCNLRCRHCVVGSTSSCSDDLTPEECQRLVDEMAGFGVQQLILSGGEPLLRPDFLDIGRHAVSHKLSLQVATNATLVTAKVAAALGEFGAAAQVSLDAADPVTHDDFRQVQGAWRRATRGIRHLLAVKVPITLAATVTTANIEQILDLYRMAADLGVTTFRILPFVPYGRGGQYRALEVSPEQMRHLTEELNILRGEVGLPIAPMEFECTFRPPPPSQPDPLTHVGCDGGIAYCTINSKGEVLPCNFFSGAEAENVREHSFEWIWHNSRFLNYFRSLVVDDIQGACQSCGWLSACRGSCLAANFAHGDIFQSNCHCWLATSNCERSSDRSDSLSTVIC